MPETLHYILLKTLVVQISGFLLLFCEEGVGTLKQAQWGALCLCRQWKAGCLASTEHRIWSLLAHGSWFPGTE